MERNIHELWFNFFFLRSLYRDILFLSLVALGKDNVDIGEWWIWKYFIKSNIQIYIKTKKTVFQSAVQSCTYPKIAFFTYLDTRWQHKQWYTDELDLINKVCLGLDPTWAASAQCKCVRSVLEPVTRWLHPVPTSQNKGAQKHVWT